MNLEDLLMFFIFLLSSSLMIFGGWGDFLLGVLIILLYVRSEIK